MQTSKRTLLTIISEASIERFLVNDIKKLGAHGYTILEARGGGAHGTRHAEDEQDRSIQIEVLCERSVAEAIAQHLLSNYYQYYAIVTYMSEVEVLRENKF